MLLGGIVRTPTALCALCLLAFGCEDSKQGPNPFGTESSTPGTSGADETTSPITTSISSSTNGTTSPPPTTTAPGTTTATTDADSGSGDMTGGSTSTGLALGDGSSSTGGEVQGEVLVQVFLMTEWPTGECNDVHVTNIFGSTGDVDRADRSEGNDQPGPGTRP